MMQETSLITYWDIYEELGERQKQVYLAFKALLQYQTDATDREVADKFFCTKDRNIVSPRRNELVKLKFLEENTKRKCTIKGRLAIAWKIKPRQETLKEVNL